MYTYVHLSIHVDGVSRIHAEFLLISTILLQIKLVYHDGRPVTDEKNYVRVKQFYSYSEDDFTESKHKLSSTGTIELQYQPPIENVTVLRIEVSDDVH